MSVAKLVSICIPAFNQTGFLKRTLDSIGNQDYRNFEVVLSDDSSTYEVAALAEHYKGMFPVKYVRNASPLGPPANWNHAIDISSGELIIVMHHDDWFSESGSLRKFVEAVNVSGAGFAFCISEILNVSTGAITHNIPPPSFLNALGKDPRVLFNNNRIGAPSAVIFKKNTLRFDDRMKYVVDIDFYIRYLAASKFVYIPEPLIVNTSHHPGQVTASSMNMDVQVGEFVLLHEKIFHSMILPLRYAPFFIRLFTTYSVENFGVLQAILGQAPRQTWYFKCLIACAGIKSKLRSTIGKR